MRARTALRRSGTTLGIAAAVLLCAGCQPPGISTVDVADARLGDDVIAAVGFSPQLSDYARIGNGSYAFALLVHADGSADTIRIGTMAGLTPLWTADALRLRDSDTNYRITSTESSVSPEPVSAIQMGSYDGITGFARVSRFDVGVTEPAGPYLQDIVAIRADGTVERASFSGSGMNQVVCDGALYGVARGLDASDHHTRFPPNTPGGDPWVLFREFPRPAPGTTDVIATQPSTTFPGLTAPDGVCSGTRAIYLAEEVGTWPRATLRSTVGLDPPPEDPAAALLAVWDVVTGEFSTVTLHGDTGFPLPLYWARAGRGSLLGDDLYWYSPTGIVYRSSITTGDTREAFRTEPEPVNVRPDDVVDRDDSVVFQDGTLYRFSVATSGDEPGSLSAWRLTTGERLFDTAVPDAAAITGAAGQLQRVWGLAIRPGFHPETVR